MKLNSFLTAFLFFLFVMGCKNSSTNNDSVSNYFSYTDTGVRTGGVKVIPIATSKGTFNIWTKAHW